MRLRPILLAPLVAAVVTAMLTALAPARAAESPRVMTTILPIHSLVAGVMSGVETPLLLVPPGKDPETYELSTKDRERLGNAQLVVALGTRTDAVITEAISRASDTASVLLLKDTPGVVGLGEDPERPTAEGAPALWLDPENAKRWVRAIAQTLIELDSDNRYAYSANAEGMMARLDALQTEIRALVSVAEGREARILFSDSLRPFARRFQESIDPQARRQEPTASVNPPGQAGDAPSGEIRGRPEDAGPICIVRAGTASEGEASADGGQVASVDILGPDAAEGDADRQYFETVRGVAGGVTACLD